MKGWFGFNKEDSSTVKRKATSKRNKIIQEMVGHAFVAKQIKEYVNNKIKWEPRQPIASPPTQLTWYIPDLPRFPNSNKLNIYLKISTRVTILIRIMVCSRLIKMSNRKLGHERSELLKWHRCPQNDTKGWGFVRVFAYFDVRDFCCSAFVHCFWFARLFPFEKCIVWKLETRVYFSL